MFDAARQYFVGDAVTGFYPNSILLTGVTGFLGKQLLHQLLDTTLSPIVCLVRAPSDDVAYARGRQLTRSPRVRFLRADMERTDLGMSRECWSNLAGSIRLIYHCAASTSFSLPLAAAHHVNVEGTRKLLELAEAALATGVFERFHYVSTAYASGVARRSVTADFLPEDRAECFRNTYERTKARAERVLRSQSRVPVTIYRPSIVAGHSVTGATNNWNVVYGPMRLIYNGRLPVMPMGAQGRIDCVPVDYVVKGIAALSSREEPQPLACYHLAAGSKYYTVADLVRVSVAESRRAQPQRNIRCRVIGPSSWDLVKRVVRFGATDPLAPKVCRRWSTPLQRTIDLHGVFQPYSEVETIFDSGDEQALLAHAGLVIPEPLDYLQRITRFAVETNFGKGRVSGSARYAPPEPVPEPALPVSMS